MNFKVGQYLKNNQKLVVEDRKNNTLWLRFTGIGQIVKTEIKVENNVEYVSYSQLCPVQKLFATEMV